jgi:hypothetical protein
MLRVPFWLIPVTHVLTVVCSVVLYHVQHSVCFDGELIMLLSWFAEAMNHYFVSNML